MDMKRCTAGDNCLHPNGPLLPISEFNKDSGKKDGLSVRCKVCRYASIKAWQQSHREIMHAYGKKYRSAHSEKDRERTRRWERANPDKVRQKNRQQHYKDLNKSHKREQAWRKSHPEYARKREQERRARKRTLPATFTEKTWQLALIYWHGVCAYCGNPPKLWDDPSVLHQDHFVPLSKDGPYTPDNILPACQSCNFGKRDSNPIQWLAERFGKRKANQILKAIYAYFDSIETQH